MKDSKRLYELVFPTYPYLVRKYMTTYKIVNIDTKLLEAKFRILIHTVIKGQLRNTDEKTGARGSVELNANALKYTIGRNSKKIIDILIEEGILKREPYVAGKRSFGYSVNTSAYPYLLYEVSLSDWEKNYPNEIEILTRTREYFDARQEEMKQSYADRFFKGNTKFIERYLYDLSLVKIKDAEALYSNVDELDYQTMVDAINAEKKKGQRMTTVTFLQGCYEEIAHYMVEQTSRWSYDDRGRIYHRLTRSPRILRHHFNIKFSIDNHNSQPLLFSTLLTRFYRITRAQLDMFCDICEHDEKTRKYPLAFVPGDSSKPIHLLPIYKEKYSWSKGLISDEIKYSKKLTKKVEQMNKVPADVWNYIYVTMNGTFWNIFQERGYSRDKVKQDLFAQVFYRKKTKKGKVPLIYGESGRAFEEMFPNVAEAITTIIRKHDDSWLPNEMTRVESVLMRKILQKVWKLGFAAVNLHDAIEIIKVPKGITLDEGKQMVKNCFREVFRKREHLLCSPDE
jgi:hypothetical protein